MVHRRSYKYPHTRSLIHSLKHTHTHTTFLPFSLQSPSCFCRWRLVQISAHEAHATAAEPEEKAKMQKVDLFGCLFVYLHHGSPWFCCRPFQWHILPSSDGSTHVDRFHRCSANASKHKKTEKNGNHIRIMIQVKMSFIIIINFAVGCRLALRPRTPDKVLPCNEKQFYGRTIFCTPNNAQCARHIEKNF